MASVFPIVLIVALVSYISAVPSHHESRPTSPGLLTKPNQEKPEDTMISILPFPFPNNQQTIKPNRPGFGSRPSRPPFTILPFPNPDPQNPTPISIQIEPSTTTTTTTEHNHADHYGDNNLHMRPDELRFFFNKTNSLFNFSNIFPSFG